MPTASSITLTKLPWYSTASTRLAIDEVATYRDVDPVSPADPLGADRHQNGAHVRGGQRREGADHGVDSARKHILSAEEFGHIAIARVGIDIARRAGLLDLAFLHHDHDVGQRDGFELGVGDVDEGDAELALHAAQLGAHLHPKLLVKRRKGLVEQQHARFGDGRAGQRHALLLAAGELARQSVGEFGQPHLLDHRIGQAIAVGLGETAHAQRESDVVAHAEMGEQRIGLEHHRRVPVDGRQPHDILAADEDFPVGRVLVAGDHAQDGGLAAAGGAEKTAIRPIGNLEVDALDDGVDAIVALGEAGEFDIAPLRGHKPLLQCVGTRTPRRFWISTIVDSATPMTTKETIVVTVPSA